MLVVVIEKYKIMEPEQFTYWLQGFVELNGETPTPEQWRSIKEHLQTVFVKVTPPVYMQGTSIEYNPQPSDYKTGDPLPQVICSTTPNLTTGSYTTIPLPPPPPIRIMKEGEQPRPYRYKPEKYC